MSGAYGTIPAASEAVPRLEYISRAKRRIESGLATCLPWKLMLDPRSITFPRSLALATKRIRTNAYLFRANYAVLALLIVFLSLLWRPISLIVFTAAVGAWLTLYFARDEPLLVFDRVLDDRLVLIFMAVLTAGALVLTRATANVLVSAGVATAVVLAHAAARKTEDLHADEESAPLISDPHIPSSSPSS